METSNRLPNRQLQEALTWLERVADGPLLSCRVAAEPVPRSYRTRALPNGRAILYNAPTYARFLHECAQQLAKQAPEQKLTGDLMAIFEMVCTKPKKTVKRRPKGDWDNLAKGPCDGITQGLIWDDDDSVVTGVVIKRWAEPGEEPGVNIWIGKLP